MGSGVRGSKLLLPVPGCSPRCRAPSARGIVGRPTGGRAGPAVGPRATRDPTAGRPSGRTPGHGSVVRVGALPVGQRWPSGPAGVKTRRARYQVGLRARSLGHTPAMPSPEQRRAPTLEEVAGTGRRRPRHRLAGRQRRAARSARRRAPRCSQAVDELGYVPNRAARALVTRRTDTVALVVSESERAVLRRAVLRRHRARGQRRAGRRRGSGCCCRSRRPRQDRDRLEQLPDRAARRRRAAAVAARRRPAARRCSRSAACPRCWAAGRPASSPPCFVDVDNEAGARAAVRPPARARAAGTVATVAGPQDMGAGVDRLAGYREALAGRRRRRGRGAGRLRRLQRGERRRRRCAALLERRPRPRRRVRRLRPDGAWARCARCASAGARSPATSRWSASTTRRSARHPRRR